MSFVALAKIEFSLGGAISTLGVSTAPYFGDASGLVNNTWYPILQPEISLEITAVLPWESGNPEDSFGTLRLVNGSDGLSDHVLDRFITAQVAGLNTETRRGDPAKDFGEMELWFLSKSDRLWFQGRTLLISQRSQLDILEQPLIDTVFPEEVPNPRLVNQTTPLLIGPAFQIAPLIWDANREVFYIARNQGKIDIVREGGAVTDNFTPTNFGFQLTAGFSLAITADAIGPDIDEPIINEVLNWQFDSWTNGEPDGLTIFESPPDSEIIQDGTSNVALVNVLNTPTADTGWVKFKDNPFDPTKFGNNSDLTFSGAPSAEEAIVEDDGSFTNAVGGIFVAEFDVSSVPDAAKITGYEIELTLEAVGTASFNVLLFQTLVTPRSGLESDSIVAFVSNQNGFDIGPDGEVGDSGLTNDPILQSKHTLVGGGPNHLAQGAIGDTFGSAEDLSGSELKSRGMYFTTVFDGPNQTVKLYQVRAKVHYLSAANDSLSRMFSDAAILTPGTRYELEFEYEAADVFVSWGGSDTQGGVLVNSADPLSTEFARLEGAGFFRANFIPNGGFFGMEFRRFSSGGTIKIKRVKIRSSKFGLNSFSELVPYMAGLITNAGVIDQSAIDAHDVATGNPEIGAYITENESFSEVMSFFVRSLSGTWWRDRDAKVRSRLWVIDESATPVLSLNAFDVDGILRQPKIAEGGEVRTAEAPNATARSVGAKNQNPLRIGETAGISEEFTPQELANVIEQWRVRRRANFDALNPWPVASPTLSLTSISPTSGDEAGGTSVTLTVENADTGASATVDFGADPATNVVVVSSTEITCDAPAGTGTVDVTVTQDGESDTLAGAFEYTDAWTPANISTALWLDADDSATITLDGSSELTQWDDKSGNNRHATADAGVITVSTDANVNRDFLDFSSASMDLPSLGITGSQNRAIFIVADVTNFNASGFFVLNFTGGSGERWAFREKSGNLRIEFEGSGDTSSLSASGLAVFAGIADGPSLGDNAVWKNGVSEALGGSLQMSTVDQNNAIGKANGSTDTITGGIREYVLLPDAPTATVREKMEGYLAHKWGLEGSLPSGHPYKSSPP